MPVTLPTASWLTKRDRFGLRIARLAALHSVCRKRVGSAILMGDKLVSFGYNQNKTHPRFGTWSLHAECNAIIKAQSELYSSVIYVVRLLANDQLSMARPCPTCLNLIVDSGIRRVVFTDYNSSIDFLDIWP